MHQCLLWSEESLKHQLSHEPKSMAELLNPAQGTCLLWPARALEDNSSTSPFLLWGTTPSALKRRPNQRTQKTGASRNVLFCFEPHDGLNSGLTATTPSACPAQDHGLPELTCCQFSGNYMWLHVFSFYMSTHSNPSSNPNKNTYWLF